MTQRHRRHSCRQLRAYEGDALFDFAAQGSTAICSRFNRRSGRCPWDFRRHPETAYVGLFR
jgi:hypothetical protein